MFRTDVNPPQVVRLFRGDRSRSGVWDGTVRGGGFAPDGSYSFFVLVRDLAGNLTRAPAPDPPRAITARPRTGVDVRRLTLQGPLAPVSAGSSRHLAIPLEQYREIADFTAANDVYLDVALDLAEEAVLGALDRSGLRPDDVDVIFSTTVTGLAVPSLEARLAARVGFRADVKRVPLFGLGCVAGAAGIARLHDYLRGWPGHVGVLLSVELCSLTVQRADRSVANLVASGLFGDGAAAVVAARRGPGRGLGPVRPAGDRQPQPSLPGHRARDGLGHGQRRVPHRAGIRGPRAGAPVPRRRHPAAARRPRAVASPRSAPGCPIPAARRSSRRSSRSSGVGPEALEITWRSLAEVGNLSSASVLHVLHDTLRDRPPRAGIARAS